ncbi:MAG: NAD(P)H-dependent oxidoreductase [Candidatus Omnitrophica bacterium]|nr:NAD(P)H-dependent oxidoreductase [Candidatus Omnitrophota bacterium]
MKSAIIYYSFTGNTHRVAQLIGDVLRDKGDEVVPVRIRPLKEETHFLTQCKEAFLSKKPDLYRTLLELKDFDRIILGSPVWAFKPAPAINTYLDKGASLEGKKAICFVTYGSGAGKENTLRIMKKGLQAKGAEVIDTISFQQGEGPAECKEKIKAVLV